MSAVPSWRGAGAAVLLVHGNTPPDAMAPLADALASDLRAGVVHRAGHGARAVVPAQPSSEAVGDLIAALDDAAAELRPPTLIRVGALDAATPPAVSRELAARIPDARLELVEGVGHLLSLEDAEATAASIRAFDSEAG